MDSETVGWNLISGLLFKEFRKQYPNAVHFGDEDKELWITFRDEFLGKMGLGFTPDKPPILNIIDKHKWMLAKIRYGIC